jgi:hypothetical protein
VKRRGRTRCGPRFDEVSRAHALRRVASFPYLNKPTKIAHVMSANPINNVLWPHRATFAIIFLSSILHFADRR